MKVLGAFVKPKGMIIHSYRPSLVLKAVFTLHLDESEFDGSHFSKQFLRRQWLQVSCHPIWGWGTDI